MSQHTQAITDEQIINTIRSISYGSVEIIIHDGKVLQLEKKEKIRFDK